MTNPIKFIAPRIAFTDPDTGVLTREGVLFLQGMFDRIGGAIGPTIGDVSVSLFEDAGSSEAIAQLFNVEQAFAQLPAPTPQEQIDQLQVQLSAALADLAELRKDLDSVRQGTLI